MKKYIDIKHLLIRLLILAVVCIGTIIVVFLSTPETTIDLETGRPRYGGNPAMGAFILVMLEFFLLGVLFFAETIWLHFKKKTQKRNANLLIASLAMVVFLAFYIYAH